jgi:hypothetical protein
MIAHPPYVVVISTPSAGVGKSTLASNLAVYLKGLAEDLPVAYVSDSAARIEAMFALRNDGTGRVGELTHKGPLQDLLTLGEFGVEYACLGTGSDYDSPNWLRKKLATSDFDGVLILDIAHNHCLLDAAIWAADLLIAPVKDPAVFGELVRLRKQLLASGASSEQIWLLPSELGAEGRYLKQENMREFLRFAGEERGFQVLDEAFIADARVQQAVEKAKPVLTRATQSQLHQQLRKLAELILQSHRQQNSYACRIKRWRADGLLPPRAARVELHCPVCRQGVLSSSVQYLESYPARRRYLLHQDCVSGLLIGTGAGAFQKSSSLLLVQSGAAHGGQAGELRLQAVGAEMELLNSEMLCPDKAAGWSELISCATGRTLAEIYADQLLISSPTTAADALTSTWYVSFVKFRKQLRQNCREEKI